MTDDIAILVRAGAPAHDFARLMADRLDFDVRRDLGPGAVVHRNYPDDGFTLHVENLRATGAPWSGYDVAITGDFGDEMLAWELFDEFEALGKPAALKSGARILRALLADPATLTPVGDEPVTLAADDGRVAAYARIVADPDADEPRLSYADLIGGLHGILIRKQIAYVHDRQNHNDWDYYSADSESVRDLQAKLRPHIVPLPVRELAEKVTVRRGFADEISLSAADYPAVAATLAASAPLQSLRLTATPAGSLERLAQVPELARLRAISLPPTREGGDAGLAALATSPYLTGLRWLGLSRSGVTRSGIEALAAAGTTPALQFVWADLELALQPEACYDYLGAHVWTNSASLARELGERYPSVAWLQRGDRDLDAPAYEDV
jgi:hypothetical protein